MLLPLHWELSESDPAVGDRTEVVPQRLDPVDEAKIEAFSGRRRSTGGDGVKGGGPMWVEIRVLQEAPVKGNFKGHGFDENNGRFPDIFSKMPKARDPKEDTKSLESNSKEASFDSDRATQIYLAEGGELLRTPRGTLPEHVPLAAANPAPTNAAPLHGGASPVRDARTSINLALPIPSAGPGPPSGPQPVTSLVRYLQNLQPPKPGAGMERREVDAARFSGASASTVAAAAAGVTSAIPKRREKGKGSGGGQILTVPLNSELQEVQSHSECCGSHVKGVMGVFGAEGRGRELRGALPHLGFVQFEGVQFGASRMALRNVLLAFTFIATGGLLFGYIIGINGNVVTKGQLICPDGWDGPVGTWRSTGFQQCWHFSDWDQGILSSLNLIGAVVSSAICFKWADVLGRKKEVQIGALLYFLGSAIAAGAPMLWGIYVGFLVYGLGIGFCMHAAPVYIAEIAPAEMRGTLVSAKEMVIVLGMFLGFAAGAIFAGWHQAGWRLMVVIAAIFACIVEVGIIFIPNSPRWLVLRSLRSNSLSEVDEEYAAEAKEALAFFRATTQQEIEEEFMTMLNDARDASAGSSHSASCSETLRYPKPLVIGCGLVFFQQVTGQPSVLYFATNIFKSAGFAGAAALSSVGVGLVKLLATLFTVWRVDLYGRRQLLLWGIFGMIIALTMLGVAFTFRHVDGDTVTIPRGAAIVTVLALMVYVSAYQVGFGPISWLMISEIFPLGVRGSALSTAAMVNFGSNILMTLCQTALMNALTPAGAFFLYLALALVSKVFVAYMVGSDASREFPGARESYNGSQEDAIIQILRSACGAIEDLSELAIPVLKKEKAESNPPGFESEGSPGTGATEAAPASASEPVLEAPPGNFTKEEHTEEKEPVETVQAIPLSEKEARGEETETKKKKRKRKHRSGPSTKKEKRKKKKVQAEEEEQAGARSTAAPVEDLTTTQEEKDLQVHENPKKFELKPAPKGIRPAHGGVLRRPAGLHRDESAPVPRELWGRGLTVQGADVPVAELAKGVELVIDEGSYFGAACRVAGTIRGLEVEREATHVLLQATGTDLESLLKRCTGAPGEHLRGHLCGPTCSGDRVAEDLIHIKKVRLARGHEEEEHWCRNLVAVEKPAGDDLRDLREKRDELKEAKEKDKSRSRRRSKKLRVKGGKEDKVAKVSSSSSSPVIQTDGTMPRAASSKSLQALFAGTGLDFKEKTRRRVARRARRLVRRKKQDRRESSSRSSTSDHDQEIDFAQEEGFFEGATKIQRVADSCPGALGARSLADMRRVLLQTAGFEEHSQLVTPTAVQYFRQELQRKSTGPVARELLTLCSSVDYLLRGRAAQAVDCLLQRVKSIESTMAGSHWSVSQRLELPPLDLQTLAPREELMSAQRAAAEDAKTRHLASLPDGRSRSKGMAKGKDAPSQEFTRRDRDRGKGKGSGKFDKGKKKEDDSKQG
ncbi:D-xylose-proton symporter-like 2 [Durusdinium trenchii]|uniref:Hexose transporter 1 n=1 Tax=Durusdinium trenchii TaxID=1381693 RepID=A0ABP0RPK2_9DINO